MRRIGWRQILLGIMGAALRGCGGHEAYVVVQIDSGAVPPTARALCVDAEVGSLSAEQCYGYVPSSVAFWLPFGTLQFDSKQNQWIGEQIKVSIDVMDSKGCVVASGVVEQRAIYRVRLDLSIPLTMQGGCTP